MITKEKIENSAEEPEKTLSGVSFPNSITMPYILEEPEIRPPTPCNAMPIIVEPCQY